MGSSTNGLFQNNTSDVLTRLSYDHVSLGNQCDGNNREAYLAEVGHCLSQGKFTVEIAAARVSMLVPP